MDGRMAKWTSNTKKQVKRREKGLVAGRIYQCLDCSAQQGPQNLGDPHSEKQFLAHRRATLNSSKRKRKGSKWQRPGPTFLLRVKVDIERCVILIHVNNIRRQSAGMECTAQTLLIGGRLQRLFTALRSV